MFDLVEGAAYVDADQRHLFSLCNGISASMHQMYHGVCGGDTRDSVVLVLKEAATLKFPL